VLTGPDNVNIKPIAGSSLRGESSSGRAPSGSQTAALRIDENARILGNQPDHRRPVRGREHLPPRSSAPPTRAAGSWRGLEHASHGFWGGRHLGAKAPYAQADSAS